jgi:pantetheine-phosphate adenylyltransferase
LIRKALLVGSFDPPTLGHLDLVKRCVDQFDCVAIAVVHNPNKPGMFSIPKRLELLKLSCQAWPTVEFHSFSGLLINLVRQLDYPVLVRGLRNSTDLDFETQMSRLNREMDARVETLFLAADPRFSHISSSYVREIGRLGGSVSFMLPSEISQFVSDSFNSHSSQ